MAHEPYDDTKHRSDLPPTEARRLPRDEEGMGLFLPLLVALALLIGVAYYFFGDAWNSDVPHVRSSDRGAVTKSEPSRTNPN